MSFRAWCCIATCAAALFVAPHASATGFHEIGQDYLPRDKTEVALSGYLRTRGEALYNLDLDRGLTPSGRPLFPVSQADPKAQTLTHWDMRLRTDVALYAPGSMVGVKARFDVLDNISLGSLPEGIPSATTTQRSPADAIRVRRAWGELLLPFGFLTAGRMGTHWGLGMVANGGDCLDCDSGDASDRVAFITPLASHIWAIAYDFSATGPVAPRSGQNRVIDLERSTNVRTVTFAWMNWKNDDVRARRMRADKTSVEYGSYITHRWQNQDVPGTYLPTAQPINPFANGGAGIMARGFRATALDGWLRLTFPWARIEAEAALLTATVDQPSLVPGVLFRDPAKSRQLGVTLQSDFGRVDSTFSAGLDGGYASGDPAPGFGVVQSPGAAAPRPGDLDGAQANPPRDNRVDNFRFHPDYRIDRILFREILGAVTDAVYARPHARVRLARAKSAQLSAHAAAIASSAVSKSSTPSGKAPLGIELDPSLVFETHAFLAALDYAVLFPLEGFDNTVANLSAKPAQLVRVRLNYLFNPPQDMQSLSFAHACVSLGVVVVAVATMAACSDNETPPPEHSPYVAAPQEALPCVPNLDGKIESRELSPTIGVIATYLVSPAGKERQVDLVGGQREGKTSWSFGDAKDDQAARLAAQKIDGKWYAASFAGVVNPVVVAIDAGGLTEGVYTHDDAAFSLHGVASASPDGNKTLLVYKTPITLYRFPLTPGVSYTTTGDITNGTFRGLPYAGRDTYEVKVDAAGEVQLPDYTLTQALRVRTKITISPSAGQPTTQRQTSFFFECLGEVVRATSKLEEPEENFQTASELRRLGLAP